MPSFESFPQPVLEKKKSESSEAIKDKARKWGGRLALAAALGGPMVGQAADVPEKVIEPAKVERVVQTGESQEQIAAQLEEARQFMQMKLNGLGLIEGMAFVGDVKKNADNVRAFLDQPALPVSFSGLLGEIVKKYAVPLTEAKKTAPALYKENILFFQKAVDVAETKPIAQVKQELIALFKQ